MLLDDYVCVKGSPRLWYSDMHLKASLSILVRSFTFVYLFNSSFYACLYIDISGFHTVYESMNAEILLHSICLSMSISFLRLMNSDILACTDTTAEQSCLHINVTHIFQNFAT